MKPRVSKPTLDNYFDEKALMAALNQGSESTSTVIYLSPVDFLQLVGGTGADPGHARAKIDAQERFETLPSLTLESNGALATVRDYDGVETVKAFVVSGLRESLVPVILRSIDGQFPAVRWGTKDSRPKMLQREGTKIPLLNTLTFPQAGQSFDIDVDPRITAPIEHDDYVEENLNKIREAMDSLSSGSSLHKYAAVRDKYMKLVKTAEKVWDSSAVYLSKPFTKCDAKKNIASFIIMGEAWSRPEDSIPSKQSLIDRCNALRKTARDNQHDALELQALSSIVHNYDAYVTNLQHRRHLIVQAYKKWCRLHKELDSLRAEVQDLGRTVGKELDVLSPEEFSRVINRFTSHSKTRKGPVKLPADELKKFHRAVRASTRADIPVISHTLDKHTLAVGSKFFDLTELMIDLGVGLSSGMEHRQFVELSQKLLKQPQAEHFPESFITWSTAQRELTMQRSAGARAMKQFASELLYDAEAQGRVVRLKDTLNFVIHGLTPRALKQLHPRNKYFTISGVVPYKFKVVATKVRGKPAVKLVYVF